MLFTSAYAQKDWQAIIDFAGSADFFQDLPFSASGTYIELLKAYPDASFILSLRRNSEEWYRSLCAHHCSLLGCTGRAPRREDLAKASYRYPGFMWEANRLLYDSPPENPYCERSLRAWYDAHNAGVRKHFAAENRSEQLLEIEIGDQNAAAQIAEFIGFELKMSTLPHLNRHLS